MLINDNLSVALALPERVGLHIGQTDLPIAHARKLLGPVRLLGHSVHSAQEAREALQIGAADYVGVGPCYGTKSKAGIADDDVLTVRGAREVIECLRDGDKRMPSVLIGGINQKTAARALFGATSQHNAPDGIAVISAIVGRTDPGVAAKELSTIVHAFKHGLASSTSAGKTAAFGPAACQTSSAVLVERASKLLQLHREGLSGPPLIQTLTSHVSSTLSANIALAFSASPIMSHQEAEADDLGKVTGAVVLNIGTIGEEARRGMAAVGSAANRTGKVCGRRGAASVSVRQADTRPPQPVVVDPVGVGASAFRKAAVEEILNHTQVTLLKGNAAELSSIAGLSEVASRGVDSGSGALSDPEGLVRRLSQRERCLVLLTGKVDYLSDGETVVRIHNGHPLLGRITGSGCALGVTVAAGMAAACNASKNADLPRLGATLVKADADQLFAGALLG